jgi:hypothetical protein
MEPAAIGPAMRAAIVALFVSAGMGAGIGAGMGAGAFAASAEPYAASGQVGYLQEWELKATLAKTASGGRVEYSGPMTLRHVGLCSANGVEEKSGSMRVTMSRSATAVEGTLAMEGDSCRLVASRAQSYSGLLTCRNGQGVPVSFSIEQESATAPGAQAVTR